MRIVLMIGTILIVVSCVTSTAPSARPLERITFTQLTDKALATAPAAETPAKATPKPSARTKAKRQLSLKAKGAELDRFIAEFRRKAGVPGVAVGVIQNGEVAFAKGYGYAALQGRQPVTTKTLFKLGATTTPLVSLMIAKLVEQDELRWQQSIVKTLPWFRFADPKATGKMTIAHALCGCTAIPDQNYSLLLNSAKADAAYRNLELRALRPKGQMGRTFQYSPHLVALGGFAAAAAYRPRVSLDSAYAAAMKQLVFAPLGMTSTRTSQRQPYGDDSARPHGMNLSNQTAAVPLAYEESDKGVEPAIGAWSNVDDMLKYLKLELSKGLSAPGYLRSSAFNTRRVKRIGAGPKGYYYGLGLYIEQSARGQVYSHHGHTAGFTTKMYFVPGRSLLKGKGNGYGVVILANRGGADAFTTIIARKIDQLIYGRADDTAALVAEYTAAIAAPKPLLGDLSESAKGLDKWVGRYRSKQLGDLVIRRQGDGLIGDFGEFQTRLRPLKTPTSTAVLMPIDVPWRRALALSAHPNGLALPDGSVFTRQQGQEE